MGEGNGIFSPSEVARIPDYGIDVVPESKEEASFLFNLARDRNKTSEEKAMIAKAATLFHPSEFNVNFIKERRNSLPTELDDKIRALIKRV